MLGGEGGGDAKREIAEPRQGPPTSQRCSIKGSSGAESSAVISSHTHTRAHAHTQRKEEFSLLKKPCKLGSLLQKHFLSGLSSLSGKNYIFFPSLANKKRFRGGGTQVKFY